ncbi:MAG: phosphate acyltransferase PlsX [Caldilinea sp.]|nr:phosphate acyltransferase PlsX [Caldilinea sp.]MCB0136857.1 phosphate acyltransferase PlsX [Caldilineaceae bacterium]MCB0041446.1 phosphate acyltransferase PlsX [Caldilinea sp.]MCB0050003.1 phosphate acyltransferase PlsX [Caldilinea sp.]MCB0149478.1 phosphate acyltransferase PlsX [Caldilineaceae bacterium]
MNIALDAMGGDHAPEAIVAGGVEAARVYGVTVSLVGQPDVIEAELKKHDTKGLNLPIVPASQIIEMEDKPAAAVRAKTDSSMVVGCKMVKRNEAQAFVSAGNTGGALAAGILHVGRIKGILRPALIGPFPTLKGACLILDIGANADVRPEHIQQFAIMGSIYARDVIGLTRPSVRILSNGEEAGKGNQLVIESFKLLEQTPSINFQGNIESKEIPTGLADVVVTDGFTGNIFVKTAETTATLMNRVITEEIKKSPIAVFGALLARNSLRRVRERMDDSHYGGAVLLGLSGVVVVAHGRSNAFAIRHAIRVAKQSVEQNILGKIQKGISEIEIEDAEAAASTQPAA